VEQAKRLLDAIGLEPDRLRMLNLSSAMGMKFAEEARSMTETVRALGPSPLRRHAVGGLPSIPSPIGSKEGNDPSEV
jgi:hypothetical protein